MKIENLEIGNVVKFTYKADHSETPIQNVELRVEKATSSYINGINVNKILDGTHDNIPYRTYRLSNIIPGTIYLKIG